MSTTGRTWAISEGDELASVECCLGGIAIRDDRTFLAGPWGPDGVTLRRADSYGGAP